jgi:branched-chain amino acid transport system permease protein
MIEYLIHTLIMINIYVILVISLNLLVGYTGLVSFAQAAFFGIGAYASTLMTVKLGLNFFLAMFVGSIISGLSGALVAIASLRLKEHYFFLGSFGFQIIIFSIIYNWISLTRGPWGIYGIPRPSLGPLSFTSNWSFLLLSLGFTIFCYLSASRIVNSPFGLILRSIREDEIVVNALGRNANFCKVVVFSISGGMAAVAGALYAYYITYIDPASFTLEESILILTMVIVGGTGNIRGSVVGAVVLILFPELLRFLNIPSSAFGEIRQMLYGLILMFFMLFRTRGIIGEKVF